jgi:hypothetical protein
MQFAFFRVKKNLTEINHKVSVMPSRIGAGLAAYLR